jgi:hypothetical protein
MKPVDTVSSIKLVMFDINDIHIINTLRFGTIRLKWKTGLKTNFHSGKLSVDWNGQEIFSLC